MAEERLGPLPVSLPSQSFPHRMLPRVCKCGRAKPATLLVCSRGRGKVTSSNPGPWCPTSGTLSWDTGAHIVPTGHSITPSSATEVAIRPKLTPAPPHLSSLTLLWIYFTMKVAVVMCLAASLLRATRAGAQPSSLWPTRRGGWWQALTGEPVAMGGCQWPRSWLAKQGACSHSLQGLLRARLSCKHRAGKSGWSTAPRNSLEFRPLRGSELEHRKHRSP